MHDHISCQEDADTCFLVVVRTLHRFFTQTEVLRAWDVILCHERLAATWSEGRRTTIIHKLGQGSYCVPRLPTPPFQHHPANHDRLHWSQHYTSLILVPILKCWTHWREVGIWRAAEGQPNTAWLREDKYLHMPAKNLELLLNSICWQSCAMILLLPTQFINFQGSNFFLGKCLWHSQHNIDHSQHKQRRNLEYHPENLP